MSTVPVDIKRGRLSGEEEAAIDELAARGLTPGQVAMRLNRHPGTINFAFHRFGLRSPTARVFNYVRKDGTTVRSFTPEEDAFIEVLRCQSYAIRAIADLLTKRSGYKRTAAGIRVRLLMLANRAELRADNG